LFLKSSRKPSLIILSPLKRAREAWDNGREEGKIELRRKPTSNEPKRGCVVGVANPAETIVGIMALIDEVRTKMEGTKLVAYSWRPGSPEAADDIADLADEALARCDDVSDSDDRGHRRLCDSGHLAKPH
jgi:hypothetical protein